MTITSSPPAPTVTKPERVPRFRRPQRWTLGHVLPVVLAIFTLIFVLAALRDRTTQTSVVVAAQQIPAGAAINTGDTRVVKMGASDARHLTGLITPAQLKGTLTAAAPIGPGEPILTGQTVTGPAGGTGLGAMSIPIPVDQADGGAIAVGDQVDIISGSTSGATYVAQHLSVLAVAAPKTTGVLSAAATSYSITVAVNQPTALRSDRRPGRRIRQHRQQPGGDPLHRRNRPVPADLHQPVRHKGSRGMTAHMRVGLVASRASWSAQLRSYLHDHVSGLTVEAILDAAELRQPAPTRLDVLVLDDSTRLLTSADIGATVASGTIVIGLYNPRQAHGPRPPRDRSASPGSSASKPTPPSWPPPSPPSDRSLPRPPVSPASKTPTRN